MPDPFREKVKKSSQGYNNWTPEKGDMLVGKFLGVREVSTRFGEAQVAEIENDDNKEVVSVFLGTVLLNQFITQKITVGERIGICYLGKEKNYKNYSVLVDRPDQPVELKPKPGAKKPAKKSKAKEVDNED